MNSAVIALGSNIEPLRNLECAVASLRRLFLVQKVSAWKRTAPVGVKNQPDFFNGALLLQTSMDLKLLKGKLKDLEDQLGRDRSRAKFGPREIDLDVVLWNQKVVDADYYSRPFLQELVHEVLPLSGDLSP